MFANERAGLDVVFRMDVDQGEISPGNSQAIHATCGVYVGMLTISATQLERHEDDAKD